MTSLAAGQQCWSPGSSGSRWRGTAGRTAGRRSGRCHRPRAAPRSGAARSCLAGVDVEQADRVGADVAVGAERAFGPARGPRGVEDGGVVVGWTVTTSGSVHPARGPCPRTSSPGAASRAARPPSRPAPRWPLRRSGQVRAVRASDPPGALVVDEQDLGARVGQPVVQLFSGPPGVQGHHHRPGRGGGPERDRPLREVPHGDGHPVAVRAPRNGPGGRGRGGRRPGSAPRR